VSKSQFGSPVGHGQSLSPVRCPVQPDQPKQASKSEKDPDVAPTPQMFCPRLESGVQLDTSVEQSLFSVDSIRTLCANTNKVAQTNIAAGINPAEIFKFIELVLYMGSKARVLKLPAVNNY